MNRNFERSITAGTNAGSDRRYEVFMDPADRFVVWDNLSGCPASMNTGALSYDTRGEAQGVADQLGAAPAGNLQEHASSGNAVHISA